MIGGGCCSIGEYERPSFGVCLRVCPAYDGPSRGAGDLLAKAIKAATAGKVESCVGCGGRQAALNGLVPFGRAGAEELARSYSAARAALRGAGDP